MHKNHTNEMYLEIIVIGNTLKQIPPLWEMFNRQNKRKRIRISVYVEHMTKTIRM